MPPEGHLLAPPAPAEVRVRGQARAQGGWMQREQALLGTAVTVQLWADDRARGAAAMAAVMAEMQRIERSYSAQRADSELAMVNKLAATQAVRISDELFQLVARALDLSRQTGGAFDISFASAGVLYDYGAGVAPDDISLARAVQAIGWRGLDLDPLVPSLRFARAGMRIDLGGFAKGHAVERSARLLQRHGIQHAIVSAGGDSRLLGDRRGRPWTVAVRDPRNADATLALLPLQDVAVSTSNDSERCFVRDGVRHHPLLDPRSGRSPTQLRSVTIVAPDGLLADALSKAVFVLGPERGMELIEGIEGVDGVLIDADGRLHGSSGFEALQPPAQLQPPRQERA